MKINISAIILSTVFYLIFGCARGGVFNIGSRVWHVAMRLGIKRGKIPIEENLQLKFRNRSL